jgi:hypothetical protein
LRLPWQLEGHFRVSFQDVPEPLVGESDFIPELIVETPHTPFSHPNNYTE